MPTTLSDWHRRMAAMVAAGNPMTPATPIRASGNHRAAQNDEPEPDEAAICIACNGSGEGMYDGTRCRSCGGSGVERTERDEPDYDAMRKERIEREMMEAK